MEPWFEIDLEGADPGPTIVRQCCPWSPTGQSELPTLAWADLDGAEHGLITVRAITGFDDYPGPEGEYQVEPIDVPDGEAWLLPSIDVDDESRFLEAHWLRSDRQLWLFESNGLSAERLVDVVRIATPGSGFPVILPDPSLALIAGTTDPFATIRQAGYEGLGAILVTEVGSAFELLVLATSIEPFTVAGADGYIGTLRNGQIEVVWDAGGGWWAALTIAPRAAFRVDEIVAAVTPAPFPDLAVYESSVEIPKGQIVAASDDLYVLHGDGDLYLHPGILSGPGGGTMRLADYADPRGPVAEGPGPNVIDHVAGVHDGALIFGDCCEPAAGNILAATRPDGEPTHIGHGYTPVSDPDLTRLASANSYGLGVIDLQTGLSRGRPLNGEPPWIDVWDLIWSADGHSLIMLVSNEDGWALLPHTAEPPFVPGEPVALGVDFGPR